MIRAGVRISTRFDRVSRAKQRAQRGVMTRQAATIRKIASRSIKRQGKTARAKFSKPGKAPKTRAGRLKRAILYSVEAGGESAVIGPSVDLIGPAASVHEIGGRYRGQQFDKRPFMKPALDVQTPQLPKAWSAKIRS